ncbi:MAG: hypothetical protein BBJ57_10265 [Desulfobacterales bacterium PC51MH44]|nr:MAG: hypothetical protein BBJ57_10265 [Desulfobacterales bacterium PC51MH44]
MKKPLWLNDEQVASLLDHTTAYKAVETALICHANGQYIQPLKPYVRPLGKEREREGGRYIAMPASVGRQDSYVPGIKWIASIPVNIEDGLPRASGLVVINSSVTGRVDAIMECKTLSARRTAAIATISFDHFAQNKAKIVALLGAGPINSETVDALMARDRGIVRFQLKGGIHLTQVPTTFCGRQFCGLERA